jgi:hypothetical protein
MLGISAMKTAAAKLAMHVDRFRDSRKQDAITQCKTKRKREDAAAPGALSSSEIEWPYQWANGSRPPHPSAMRGQGPGPGTPPRVYKATVHALVHLSASVIDIPSTTRAIKIFDAYALPVFHWAQRECRDSIHLFTQLVNDAFVNLTVPTDAAADHPQMYHDCGDMVATILNAHAYHTGADKVNSARYNCVAAVHFVLLGHLYWRERGWSATKGDAVVAVFYQTHIAICLPKSPQYYENTIGVLFTREQYASQIDATITRPGATMSLSGYADLICSHRINALEMCRDTRMRGCSVGEAQAWRTCLRVPESTRKVQACRAPRTAAHFLCANEAMFTNLKALTDLMHIIQTTHSLHIGFPVVFHRAALWLAMHQKPAAIAMQWQPAAIARGDARQLVLTLWESFDPRPATGPTRKHGVSQALTEMGVTPQLLKETMSEWDFVSDMAGLV